VLGLDVVCGTLPQACFTTHTFDVITLWNVLEHMCDPLAVLRQAHSLLRQDGILVLAVPVLDSLLRQWFGSYWIEWDLPRHMYLFSYDTLRRLLHTANFDVQSTTAPFSEYRVFQMSLTAWLQDKVQSIRLRHGIGAIVQFPLVRAGIALLLRVLVAQNRSSVPIFVCRKV